MKTILLAAAFAALPGFAIGQTITQTLNFSGIPDFSAPLLFDKYDGPAANLLNVNVSYSITVQGGQFIVDNDADTPANVTANFGAGLDTTNSPDVHLLDASFNQIINGVAVTNSATFNLAANVGDGLNDYDSSGPDGAILVGTTKNTTGGADVNALFRNEFVGPGQFTITAIAKQIGSLSYNSGIETATTPVNAFGTITVTYKVIPEPGSTMLLGLSAIGLALRRRRRA
jgi:hypothetical protein